MEDGFDVLRRESRRRKVRAVRFGKPCRQTGCEFGVQVRPHLNGGSGVILFMVFTGECMEERKQDSGEETPITEDIQSGHLRTIGRFIDTLKSQDSLRKIRRLKLQVSQSHRRIFDDFP
jgi:hypothetical protein